MKNDSDWNAKFVTTSRPSFVKASVVISAGLHQTCLNGRENKVVITGTPGGGKSLLVDTITADLSDDFSPYLVEYDFKSSFFEEAACDACDEEKKMDVTHNGHKLSVSFAHAEKVEPQYFLDLKRGVRHRGRFISLGNILSPLVPVETPKRTALVMMSSFIPKGQVGYVSNMVLCVDIQKRDAFNWNRAWDISIPDGDFRTPQMHQALENLRGYEANRQSRLAMRAKVA